MLRVCLVSLFSLFSISCHAAFLDSNAHRPVALVRPTARPNVQPLHLFEATHAVGDAITTTIPSILGNNGFWLATIDADIDSIPTDEFATVFAGGITVMFGGVFSALVVGFILDSKNLYANVVADSYAQGAEDEDFWKGLSDEERRKAQELIQKVKIANNGGEPLDDGAPAEAAPTTTASPVETTTMAAEKEFSIPEPTKKTKNSSDGGMFSDY